MTQKLNTLRDRHSVIQAAIAELSNPNSNEEDTQRTKKLKIQEEELVQLMLKIDGIETVGNEQLRNLRKSTVKEVQETLDRLDRFLKSK